MKNKVGVLYYNIRETGYHINRSYRSILEWIKINQALIESGEPGVMPTPTLINNVLYFSQSDIKIMKESMRHINKGDFKAIREKLSACCLSEGKTLNLLAKIMKKVRG